MADDIASIDIVVPIIFGFFATKPASAVPAPTAIWIIRPAFKMKNNDKAIIAGAGAVLAYLYLEKNKEKKTDISDVSISPTEFYA